MAALEFCLPPEDAARLVRLHAVGRQRARAVTADIVWHDTADGALDREGLSLRACDGLWRLEAARPTLGVPWAPGTPPPLLAEAPDPGQLPQIGGHALRKPLMPLAGFHGHVRVLAIASGDDAPCTMTMIEGALRGVTQDRRICRVRLDGPASRLLAISTAASAAVRLTAPRWSLATEAASLARVQPPPPRRTGAPQILPGTSLADAITLVLGHLSDVILTGAATAGDGQSATPVHQMRVAVRRLRSALSVFHRAASGSALDDLKPGLKHLAATLGRAREWDVFLEGTGAAIAAAIPGDRRVAAMLTAGARQRAGAYTELRHLLAGETFRQLEIALVQVTALRLWEADGDLEQAERLRAEVTGFASQDLKRQLARLMAPGSDIAGLPAEALHTTRKAAKRMRYACEFFAPLYGRRATRRFIERLAELQEALGHLNDMAAAGSLMASLGAGADRRYAAGVVHGFVAARAGDTRRDIEAAWRKFGRQDAFWS